MEQESLFTHLPAAFDDPWKLAVLVLLGLCLIMQIILLFRSTPSGKMREVLEEESRKNRDERREESRDLRIEVGDKIKDGDDSMVKTLVEFTNSQNSRLNEVRGEISAVKSSNQETLDRIRNTFEERIGELREMNEKKLDEMRLTVDEKLQDTLQKRLGESFSIVSDRLEKVQEGLGEMRNLASGVGDLKRVLTNVKSRGTWAEVQLGAILEEILTPNQFSANVATNEASAERVEFAVRLPGVSGDPDGAIWLPIDSKFPTEDYQRLQAAADAGERTDVDRALGEFVKTIRKEAKRISEKYINPPTTTDFAVMFLATEGMYAEALRQPGLLEDMQREFRIIVAGPTTLTGLLTSLRMGFRTLAIEKQASDVWQVLGAVKTEFGSFCTVLDKVKKQLNSASNTIDETGIRTRAMERRLRDVEQLPDKDAARILRLEEDGE